jgi:dephospho-CoA kinase
LGHPEIWGPAGERLLIVGLTGGIASGKTEVDRQLEKMGLLVIDADEVARCVVEPGTATYDTLVRQFGDRVLDPHGCIDRAELASIVFSDDEKRMLLNSITHPAIFQEMIRRVAERAETLDPGDVPAVVLDAALIVDTGVSGVFDILAVVTADEETRVKRMVQDRRMSQEEARTRIASQTPDSKRIAMADIVIENNGTIDELRESLVDAFQDIAERAGRDYS